MAEAFWGEPAALAMNHELLLCLAALDPDTEDGTAREVNRRPVLVYRELQSAAVAARAWLCNVFDRELSDHSIVVAGRNVAAFDLRFLPIELTSVFHHRCLDVASMAMGAWPHLWEDRQKLPNTSTLLKRSAEHTAIGDARQVVEAIRGFRGITK